MNNYICCAAITLAILVVGSMQMYMLNARNDRPVARHVNKEKYLPQSDHNLISNNKLGEKLLASNEELRSALTQILSKIEREQQKEGLDSGRKGQPSAAKAVTNSSVETSHKATKTAGDTSHKPTENTEPAHDQPVTGATSQYELVFCMPTSPRFTSKHEQIDGYLSSTLKLYLANLMADPVLKARSLVVIMNTAKPGENKAFTKAKSEIQDPSFVFLEHIDPDWVDPRGNKDPKPNPKGLPGVQARKQTHDVMSLLSICRPSHMRAGKVSRKPIYPVAKAEAPAFISLVEDDFFPCPFGLSTMFSVLKLLPACRPRRDWALATFAEGMNGIVIHDSKVDAYLKYMASQQAKRPCDLMIREKWFKDPVTREPHKWMEFKFYLFQHMGRASSFHFRMERKYIRKYGFRKGRGCYQTRESYAYNRGKKTQRETHTGSSSKLQSFWNFWNPQQTHGSAKHPRLQSSLFPLQDILWPCNANPDDEMWALYKKLESSLPKYH